MLHTKIRRRKTSVAPAAHPAPPEYRRCGEARAIARQFSPLISEMLALYCHTRPIGALSQSGNCPDEYRVTARQIIQRLLEGWINQTWGHGTIDDLLPEPRHRS